MKRLSQIRRYNDNTHLAARFLEMANKKADALLFFDKRDGQWQMLSYHEVAMRVVVLAKNLRQMGLQSGTECCYVLKTVPAGRYVTWLLWPLAELLCQPIPLIQRAIMPISWAIPGHVLSFARKGGLLLSCWGGKKLWRRQSCLSYSRPKWPDRKNRFRPEKFWQNRFRYSPH